MDLLERGAALAALESLLERAGTGAGHLALVGGEAGVGKTALVQHVCARVREQFRVLVGACDPLSTPRPLGPLLDVAHDAGGELARLVAADAPRHLFFRAALDALSNARPTLFVIEDAHWADEATLDLLRFLGRRIGGTRSLLLVTYRDDEVGPAHPLRIVIGDLATATAVHRIALASLSLTAVRTLATDTGHDPVALYQQTGGNPFFVTEVLAGGGHGLPPTVQDAILARVARLPLPARSILEAAAVIGARIEPWLLDEIGGEDAAAIDECLRVGMLRTDRDMITFRNDLSREAVLATIPARQRRVLHTSVLASLRSVPSSSDDLARLAHHAEAAGDREAVLTFAPAAARRATELGATREAIAQYARTLRFSEELPDRERLALLEAYADVADLADWGSAGVAPRNEMIDLARRSGDRLKEADHLGWLAITLSLAGQPDDAERSARAALALLDGVPEGPAHARVYCTLAELGVMRRDIAGAVAWGERAIVLSERLGEVQALILALNTTGEARLVGGDEARGRADLERCLELAREGGFEGFVAGTLAHLGTGYGEGYRFDQADRYLAEAVAYATEHDLDGWRHWSTAWLATTRLFQGRWTQATELAMSVLRVPTFAELAAHDPGTPIVAPSYAVPVYVRIAALVPLGRVRARRGDPEVVGVLDEAQSLAEQIPHHYSFCFVAAARAEAAWLAGDRRQTALEAGAAFDLATQRRQTWLAGELAYWRWKAGDPADPPPRDAAPFALQVAGEWAAAAAEWNALGCRYEAARALAEGDDQAALFDAMTIFGQLGAEPALQGVEQRLHEMGVRNVPRGPHLVTHPPPVDSPPDLHGLTPRELDVLRLLVEGRSDKEIGAALFLSHRTVMRHVTGILAKLGVENRTAATHYAGRHGLL